MESTLKELKAQLATAEENALKSLRAEGVVGEKFKLSQKAMTNRMYELVESLRKRIEESIENKTPHEKMKKLTIKEVQTILDNEDVTQFEPGQVLNLPINTLK